MNDHPFIFEYFWLIAIIVNLVNGAIFKFRSLGKVPQPGTTNLDCDRIILGYIFWLSLPWLIVGVGTLTGHLSNMFELFRPQDLNPFTLAFFGCLSLEELLLFHWVFFRGGAEHLGRFPWLFRGGKTSPGQVKFQAAMMLVGGIVALGLFWSGVLPIPRQR